MKLIDKAALVVEIDKRIADNKKDIECASHKNLEDYFEGYEDALVLLKEKYLDALEVKEINTWHLQKNEDIYDAVKDWSLHSFICLMDDGSIQKFTGTRGECADGSINIHIDAIDDKYNTDNIIFWIETPL